MGSLSAAVVLASDVMDFTDYKCHLNSGLDSKREYIGSAFVGRHLHLLLHLPAGICICQGPFARARGQLSPQKIRCRNLVHALGSMCGHIRGAPPPFADASTQDWRLTWTFLDLVVDRMVFGGRHGCTHVTFHMFHCQSLPAGIQLVSGTERGNEASPFFV